MAKDQTSLSIDKETKAKAEIMAKNMHLSLSGVTRILLNDFADGKIKIATVMVSSDENDFSRRDRNEMDLILNDVNNGKNIEGPFESAEEFISSMKS